jgi:hypothetical protein
MGPRKLSRDINMNHQYKIYKKRDIFMILEFIENYGSKSGTIWDIEKLKKSLQKFKQNELPYENKEERIESFHRTKKWLYENHPELLI